MAIPQRVYDRFSIVKSRLTDVMKLAPVVYIIDHGDGARNTFF